MGENEATDGAGSGMGMAFNVVLTADIKPNQVSGELNSAIATAADGALSNLRAQSEALTQALQTIQKVAVSMHGASKAVRGNTSTVPFIKQVDALASSLTALQVNPDQNSVAAFSSSAAGVLDLFKSLAPTLTAGRIQKKSAKLNEGLNTKALMGELTKRLNEYNGAVVGYADSQGVGTSQASPSRKVMTDVRGLSSSSYTTEAREALDLARRRRAFAKRSAAFDRALPPTKGISLDTETANSNSPDKSFGDLWAVAFATQEQGSKKLTRNLMKDKIQLNTFNRKYAQGLDNRAGETVTKIVSDFYDAWAGTSPTGTLHGQLPPITGHNLDFDLKTMRQAAEQALAASPKNSPERYKAGMVSQSMTRLLSGDQRATALAGDTSRLWSDFVQNDLGYSAHSFGKAGTMGNALPAIARGLGIDYDAHDPLADMQMSDMLRRSLSSQQGRASVKKMFNYDNWLKGAEDTRLRSNFLDGMTATYGEQNKHLGLDYLAGKTIPYKEIQRLESISPMPISGVYEAARHDATLGAVEYDKTLSAAKAASSLTIKGNQPNTPKVMDELFLAAKSNLRDVVSQTLSTNIPKGIQDAGLYEKDLKRLFQEPAIDQALTRLTGTFGIQNSEESAQVKSKLRNDMVDAYRIAGVNEAGTDKHKAERELARREGLAEHERTKLAAEGADLTGFGLDRTPRPLAVLPDHASVKSWIYDGSQATGRPTKASLLDQLYSEHKTTPDLNTPMQAYGLDALRVTNLAATNLPAGHAQLKTLPFLRDVALGKNPELPAPPESMQSAFKLGDVFEKKALQYLKDNFSKEFDVIGTNLPGDKQFDLQLGKFNRPVLQPDGSYKNTGKEYGFTAHPDGFIMDKKSGEVSVLEAKYRGAENLVSSLEGGIPGNYKAQAAAYAMAAGMPNMPTQFLMGNLVKTSPEIRKLEQDLAHPNLSAKGTADIKSKIEELKKNIAPEAMELGNLEMIKVAPNAALQRNLREAMQAITGTQYTEDMVGKLPAKLEKFFATGKKTREIAALEKASELIPLDGSILETRNMKVASVKGDQKEQARAAKKEQSLEIGSGNAGKPPGSDNSDFGGGSSLPPEFNPKIGKNYNEKVAIAEKMLENANVKVEKARIDLAAKEAYLKKASGGGSYNVPDHGLAVEAISEAQKNVTLAEREAKGLTAEVARLRAGVTTQPPPDLKSETALAIRGDLLAYDPKKNARAQEAAFNASARIKKEGFTLESYKEADAAAKQLQDLGIDRTAGYSRRQLLNKAIKSGIQISDVKLDDVSSSMTSTAAISGIKGDASSLTGLKTESLEAAKAVEGLFKQLGKHATTDFMSSESKAIKDFILESQKAQEAAINIRATAGVARENEAFYKKAGAPVVASQYGKDATKLEADALAQERLAQDLANKARLASKAMAEKPISAEQYKEQYVKDQDTQLRTLADRTAQLKGRALMPGYQVNRADRDELDLINRQQKSITSGKPLEGQKFSWISEVKLSTQEAEEKYNKLRLKLQQEAVQIKAEINLAGMDKERLNQVIGTNLQLAKQGTPTPGMSTYDAIQESLKVKSLKPNTRGYTDYFDAVSGNVPTAPTSAFDSLIARDELARNTVKSLYTSLGNNMPTDSGLTGNTKQIYKLEEEARRAIDKVGTLSKGQNALLEEANVTTDPGRNASLLAQADNLAQQRDAAQLQAKEKILAVEQALNAVRVDPKGAAATEARTTQYKAQLEIEQRQLEAERQMLALKIRADGGKHATGQDLLRAQTLNQTLQTRFGVGVDSSVVGSQEIKGAAKNKGIDLDEMQRGAGGQGRSKDFIGGAIDLLDWQVQWIAGVTILNTFTSAVKNSIGFAIQFEAAMKNVKLITQASTTDMAQLVSVVSTLASNFQYSALELGEGLVILGQAGFDAAESLAILPNITALATATMSSLKVAADITTTAIEAFEVPLENVSGLVNALAAMTIESKLDIEKLGTSFNYIASTAAAAGFSVEETGTAMGLMSNAGVRASTIGTSLRSIIGSLMSPTAKFAAALAEVGLSAEDISPKTNTLGEIFAKLREAGFDVESAFDGLDKRIAGATVTLVNASGEFDSFQGKITGTNRAFEMAEGQMETFSAQVKRMQNSFQLLGGDWFGSSLDPLQTAASSVNVVLGLLKEATGLVPDVVKTGINSTLALTSGLSIGGGLISGVLKTRSNINAALDLEDKDNQATIAAGGTPVQRGDTLKGRNKQVYSTMMTIFDPKMIALAAGITVGLLAFGEAVDYASGKTQLLRDTAIADKLKADSDALRTTTASFLAAAEGTQVYVQARKQLEKLGVTDFSKEGLERRQQSLQARGDVAQDNLAKSSVTYNQSELARLFDNSTELDTHRKSLANTVGEYMKRKGTFWSGDSNDMLIAMKELNFDSSNTEDFSEVSQLLATAHASPDRAKFARAEVRSSFLSATAGITNADASIEEARLDYNDKLTRFQSQSILPIDKLGPNGEVIPEGKHVTKDEVVSANSFYKSNKKAMTKFKAESEALQAKQASKYVELVINNDPENSMSGSERAAAEAVVKAVGELNRLKEKFAADQLLPEDDRKTALLHVGKQAIEAAQQVVRLSTRKYALKSGLKGMPQEYMQTAADFLEFLTIPDSGVEGGLAVDEAGFKAFKGLNIGSLGTVSKKLKDNQIAKQSEILDLKKLFSDDKGNLLQEVQAAVNIKYKLKAEEIVQADLDAAFKPLKTAYEQLANLAAGRESIITTSIKNELIVDDVLSNSAYKEAKVQRSLKRSNVGTEGRGYNTVPVTVFGEGQTREDEEKTKQELERLKAKRAAELSAFNRESEFMYTTKEQTKQQTITGNKNGFATPENRRAAELELEINYYKKSIELSTKRRDQLIADEQAISNVRAQLADKLTNIEKSKYALDTSQQDLVAKVEEKLYPGIKTGPTNSALFDQANEAFDSSKKLLQEGKLDQANSARERGYAKLNAIVSKEDVGATDLISVRETSKRAKEELDFEYNKLAEATKTALAETNSILNSILASINKLAPGGADLEKKLGSNEEVNNRNKAAASNRPMIEDEATKTRPILGYTQDEKGNFTKPYYGSAVEEKANANAAPALETTKELELSLLSLETEYNNIAKKKADELAVATLTIQEVVDTAGESIANKFLEGFRVALPIISKELGDAVTSAFNDAKISVAKEAETKLEQQNSGKAPRASGSKESIETKTEVQSTPQQVEVKISFDQSALQSGITAAVVNSFNALPA